MANESVRLQANQVHAQEEEVATGDVIAQVDAIGPQTITLDLEDLMQDGNGEIVLFNDSHMPTLALRAEHSPKAQGDVATHITAGGDDVSGFHFVALENGPTLYYQEGLDLMILTPKGEA